MFKRLTSNTPLACLPHDHSRCVADALAEAESLCAKQGTRLTTLRKRVLPSGRPTEETERLECPDPTWVAEYTHFKSLCTAPAHNLDNDIWINDVFNRVRAGLGLPVPPA